MSTRTIGLALIILGILMMAYTGFTYITTKNVVDMGPIQINHDENHFVQWPPFVGAILLVAGVVVMFNNKKVSA